MSDPHTDAPGLSQQKAAEIERWARRYARNRTLAFLLALTFLMSVILGLSFFARQAGRAWRADSWIMFAVYAAPLLACVGLIVWFARPHFGGRFLYDLAQRFYGHEGHLALNPPAEGRRKVRIAAFVLMGLVPVQVFLGAMRWLPEHLMQPFSALYVVPFLVLITKAAGGTSGLTGYLWAALYALHAVLVILGLPVQFTGTWASLNVAAPLTIYGVTTGLVGHLYSRYALKRLREAAR